MTPADTPFLHHVFRACREAEFAALPWSAAERDAFFTHQSAQQEQYYDTQMAGLTRSVIDVAGKPAGRLYVARDKALTLVDIALLPAFRRRGVGRYLLQDLLREATSTGKRVVLHVEADNPARAWYGRLGFTETGQHGIYVHMESNRKPPPHACPATTS